MTEPLSEIQQRSYNVVRDYIRRERRPPTIDEICAATGIKSKSHVHFILGKLVEKGWIAKDDGKARGLRLIHEPGIPVLGRIAAGEPIEHYEADERPELDLSTHTRGDIEEFALLVRGNSMIDDRIYDGDYVLVRPAKAALDGEIVVATHLVDNGAATVKRFFTERDHKRVRLQPANATMDPIYVPSREWSREWEIQGVVTGVYRDM